MRTVKGQWVPESDLDRLKVEQEARLKKEHADNRARTGANGRWAAAERKRIRAEGKTPSNPSSAQTSDFFKGKMGRAPTRATVSLDRLKPAGEESQTSPTPESPEEPGPMTLGQTAPEVSETVSNPRPPPPAPAASSPAPQAKSAPFTVEQAMFLEERYMTSRRVDQRIFDKTPPILRGIGNFPPNGDGLVIGPHGGAMPGWIKASGGTTAVVASDIALWEFGPNLTGEVGSEISMNGGFFRRGIRAPVWVAGTTFTVTMSGQMAIVAINKATSSASWEALSLSWPEDTSTTSYIMICRFAVVDGVVGIAIGGIGHLGTISMPGVFA